MPEHAFTRRWYDGLPASYRGLDTLGQLLGFMRALGDEAGVVEDLVDRFDRVYPGELGYDPAVASTSDLVDPLTADAVWLPYVGQLYGVRLDRAGAPSSYSGTFGELSDLHATLGDVDAAYATFGDLLDELTPDVVGLTEEEQRRIIDERPGWLEGSTGAVRALITPHLTGERRVRFIRNQGPVGAEWARVVVRTYEAETPAAWLVVAELARDGVAPAGVELVHEVAVGADFGEVADGFATFGDVDAEFADLDALRHWLPPV